MATSDNTLRPVQTYQRSALAYLVNMFAFINKANKKFQNFQDRPAQLGGTVTYDKPPRMVSNSGLVVGTFDSVAEEIDNLSVDQQANVNFSFSAEQLVFYINNNDYLEPFARSGAKELGTRIETDVASVIPSRTFRFYSAGVTGSSPSITPAPINSIGQIALAKAQFTDFGAAQTDFEMYVPNISVPGIVNSMLNQFVLKRNEEIANSWELGRYDEIDFYRSNLLPLHISGTTGNSQQLLTVVSVTRQADGGITSITFSGATNLDANAVKTDDLFEFKPASTGVPHYLTWIGHATTGLNFQFRATANVTATSGGNVTIPVDPVIYDPTAVTGNPLIARYQNSDIPIVAGLTALGVPTHRCGLLISGKPLYIAMPRLPSTDPYEYTNEIDDESGAALRFYGGAGLGNNVYGHILDAQWGKQLVKEYAMRMIFPPYG